MLGALLLSRLQSVSEPLLFSERAVYIIKPYLDNIISVTSHC